MARGSCRRAPNGPDDELQCLGKRMGEQNFVVDRGDEFFPDLVGYEYELGAVQMAFGIDDRHQTRETPRVGDVEAVDVDDQRITKPSEPGQVSGQGGDAGVVEPSRDGDYHCDTAHLGPDPAAATLDVAEGERSASLIAHG